MPLQLETSEKACDDNERCVTKYQNTYRMEPQNPFKTDPVDKIVRSVMNNRLDEVTYDDAEVTKLCGDIATEIRRRVKKLNFDRNVIVVEKRCIPTNF
ncbi:PREDICTED: tctex1 domain-containing protein 3-like isoform X2 [Vollenhovia emeryi]|uniref:tctex1 domain-containing protein 3-like isoform X2 n=1 Tax=Vollenhovia emeryi TaxID=411798 RepID=UPI0005F4C6FF|nr:PREDICTED: tctex1 domain-containing protein 3-like isoform X2 [Vollenhovia emeryi]